MKTIVIISVLFFFFTPRISGFARTTPPPLHLQSSTSNQCEYEHHKGNFTCIKNDDDTYNVTFDCHQIGLRRVELVLQYPDFPKKMKDLKIQNCDVLILDLHCQILSKLPGEEVSEMIHISHLHIANINHFVLRKERDNETSYVTSSVITFRPRFKRWIDRPGFKIDRYDEIHRSWLDEDSIESEDDFKESMEMYYLNDLVVNTLTSVTLENIKHANLEGAHLPLSLFRCEKRENSTLESFKMINIKSIHFGGLGEYSTLREFVMDNVTVLPKNTDGPLVINNTQAIVKIINSDISKMTHVFKGISFKLTIQDNKMTELSENAILFGTEELIFSGNVIQSMMPSSLQGDSVITQVTNNVIHRLYGKSTWYRSDDSDSDLKSHDAKKIYNFSNNEMHILQGEADTFPSIKSGSHYESITISNNTVNCTCQNMMWFAGMTEDRYSFRSGLNFWLKKVDQNKCLNIPNCSLAQIMTNYYDLCETDYQCPKTVSKISSSTHFLRQVEEILGNTLHVNKENSETNVKILQLLKNENQGGGSLLTINTLCLVFLLLLCCIIFGYFILTKTGKLRGLDFRARRLRSSDSEMNSHTSLTS